MSTAPSPFTAATHVVFEQAETACPSAVVDGDQLWLSAEDLQAATGWMMKPEGLCKGPVCVPVPPVRAHELVRGAAINAAGFWRHMGHPVVHDAAGAIWVLGTGAGQRSQALQSLEAPDFALPDPAGAATQLSRLRGKKVLLATWASW